jgi:hypothetical protein
MPYLFGTAYLCWWGAEIGNAEVHRNSMSAEEPKCFDRAVVKLPRPRPIKAAAKIRASQV